MKLYINLIEFTVSFVDDGLTSYMASPAKGLALTPGYGYTRLLRGQGKLLMAQLGAAQKPLS